MSDGGRAKLTRGRKATIQEMSDGGELEEAHDTTTAKLTRGRKATIQAMSDGGELS